MDLHERSGHNTTQAGGPEQNLQDTDNSSGRISPQTFCHARTLSWPRAGALAPESLALMAASSLTGPVTLCFCSVICKMGTMTAPCSHSCED